MFGFGFLQAFLSLGNKKYLSLNCDRENLLEIKKKKYKESLRYRSKRKELTLFLFNGTNVKMRTITAF